MNEPQARTLSEAHAGYAQRVSRMTKAQLAAEYLSEQRARGTATLYGGPSTKDELISALVGLRYPAAKMRESIHVLYHSAEFPNDACAYCNPNPCPKCGALDTCDYESGMGAVVNGRHINA